MYTLVLTHDIDYLSLKEIPWSCKTLWGFSYRCIKAALSLPFSRLGLKQRAMLLWDCVSMPLIKLGYRTDPWAASLDMIIEMEKRLGVRSTLYFIPFPHRAGVTRAGRDAPYNRSAFYTVREHQERLRELEKEGWEIGVHGIDAYWNETSARQEKQEIEDILGHEGIGIRMHWLYYKDCSTWEIFSRVGFLYDASLGWNEKIGFPDDHYTPFHPFEGEPFQLLPLNIQDQALFEEMELTDEEAWAKASAIIEQAKAHNAVLTLLWHNNSFTSPMFWGAVYERIIRQAQADGANIIRAIDAVNGQYEHAS